MKKNFKLFIGVLVLFIACKKNDLPANGSKVTLQGTWEIRRQSGGNILPATFAPGNGSIISFGDTTYAAYTAGTLQTKLYYQQISNGTGLDTVIFSHNVFSRELVTIVQNDTLKIVPLMPDIATGYYVKTGTTPLFK